MYIKCIALLVTLNPDVIVLLQEGSVHRAGHVHAVWRSAGNSWKSCGIFKGFLMIFCKPHVHVYTLARFDFHACMQFYTFDTCKGMVEERFPSLSNSWKNGQLPLISIITHDHSLATRSLTHTLAHSITHSLIHSLTHTLTHSYTHSLTHSLIDSLIHSLIHSHTHLLHVHVHGCNHAVTNFSVGTVSGGAAAVAAHPLDVIRTRFVGQGQPKVCRGIFYHLLHLF